jgi:putative ABC transport system ATP-binding protein
MSEPVLSLRGIRRDFPMGNQWVRVLKGIDLDVQPGEYIALMGPSGSGKSTLMNLLGCLDTPTSGSYFLAGEDVSRMDDDALAEVRNKKIGFVFQTFNLLPRQTALQNVALPLVYAGWSKADRLAHQPNQLSGGQRQRVAIARALVNTPSMVLADEPTGNLDSATSVEIMRLFDEIHAQGNTLVVVTHEEDIARHAKRIVRMRDGLIESDEPNR